EAVLLLDRDPRKLPASAGELVATARMLLLGGEQLPTRRQPFLPRSQRMLDHQEAPFRRRPNDTLQTFEIMAPRTSAPTWSSSAGAWSGPRRSATLPSSDAAGRFCSSERRSAAARPDTAPAASARCSRTS